MFNVTNEKELLKVLKDQPEIPLNKHGSTPLHHYVVNRRIESIKAILKHTDIDVNYRNSNGQTALHLVNDKNQAKILLDNGANPFIPDNLNNYAFNNKFVQEIFKIKFI